MLLIKSLAIIQNKQTVRETVRVTVRQNVKKG